MSSESISGRFASFLSHKFEDTTSILTFHEIFNYIFEFNQSAEKSNILKCQTSHYELSATTNN